MAGFPAFGAFAACDGERDVEGFMAAGADAVADVALLESAGRPGVDTTSGAAGVPVAETDAGDAEAKGHA